MRMLVRLSFPLLVMLMLTAIYQVKYDTWRLRRAAEALQTRIAAEQRAIALLRADLAHLSRPGRIEQLARQHLHMAPVKPSQIVVLDD